MPERGSMSIYDKLVGATSEGLLPPTVLAHLAVPETTATASSTTTDYWVSPTGDDKDTGSEATPFRTLARAVAAIPDLVRSDHHYKIHLAAGDWGDETFQLEHRLVYGQLTVTGTTGDREQHRVHRVRVNSIFGRVRFENITATRAGTLAGPSWWIESAMPWIEVYNCKALAVDPSIREISGVIGLLADYGSVVHAEASDFNGRRYGLRANYSSRIYSKNNTGEGNVFGVGARWGGIMNTYGTQPGADTTFTTDSGGIISRAMGAKLGLDSQFGLVQEDSQGDRPPTRRRYLIRSIVTGINSDIGPDQAFRVRIRAKSYGYATIRVNYGGQVNTSAGQGIEKVFGILLRSSTSTSEQEATVLDHSMGSQNVRLQHTGANGEIDLIVQPQAALAGRWGIDLDMSLMTQQEAPEVISVDLVSV